MCVCIYIKSNHFSVHLKHVTWNSSTPVFKKQQNGYSETTDMERPGQEITGRTARVSKVLRRSQRESEKLRHVKTVTYKVDSAYRWVLSPRQDMCSEQHLRETSTAGWSKAQSPYTSVKVFPGVQQWTHWDRWLFFSNAQCSTKYHKRYKETEKTWPI